MLSITGTIPSRCIALALFTLSWVALPRPAEPSPRVVHVFVTLADNQYQGIIPVPAALGNGSGLQRNLYWGAAFGLKTFFRASDEWHLLSSGPGPKPAIQDRCVFKKSQ